MFTISLIVSVFAPSSCNVDFMSCCGGISGGDVYPGLVDSLLVGPKNAPPPNIFCCCSGDAERTETVASGLSPVTILLPTRIPPVVVPPANVPRSAAAVLLPDTSLVGSIRDNLPSMKALIPSSSPPSAADSLPTMVANSFNSSINPAGAFLSPNSAFSNAKLSIAFPATSPAVISAMPPPIRPACSPKLAA